MRPCEVQILRLDIIGKKSRQTLTITWICQWNKLLFYFPIVQNLLLTVQVWPFCKGHISFIPIVEWTVSAAPLGQICMTSWTAMHAVDTSVKPKSKRDTKIKKKKKMLLIEKENTVELANTINTHTNAQSCPFWEKNGSMSDLDESGIPLFF